MQNGTTTKWTPDPFTRGFIAQRVRELRERGRLAGWETDDIRNELLLNVWRRQGWFDPRRGSWTTFVRLVTDHHVADLLTRWRRHQRLPQTRVLPIELEASLDEQIHDRRLGGRRRSGHCSAQLIRDVAEVLEQLPEADRLLCRELRLYPIAEVARRFGCSRSTVYQRIRRILPFFERSEMRGYL